MSRMHVPNVPRIIFYAVQLLYNTVFTVKLAWNCIFKLNTEKQKQKKKT